MIVRCFIAIVIVSLFSCRPSSGSGPSSVLDDHPISAPDRIIQLQDGIEIEGESTFSQPIEDSIQVRVLGDDFEMTDHNRYTIPVLLVNIGLDSIYVETAGSDSSPRFIVDKLDDSGWNVAYAPIYESILTRPVGLASGDSLGPCHFTLYTSLGRKPNFVTESIESQYRFRFFVSPVYYVEPEDNRLSMSVASNIFRLSN